MGRSPPPLPYSAPPVRHGDVVFCEACGDVTVVGVTDGPIPWPVGKKGRARAPILCGDWVEAVRRESNQGVVYWWGVTPQIVTKWRKADGKREVRFSSPRTKKPRGGSPGPDMSNGGRGRRLSRERNPVCSLS